MPGLKEGKEWVLLVGWLLLGACGPEADPTAVQPSYAVGQNHGGGIIFYLDGTGEHGLIAAPTDLGDEIPWSADAPERTGASGSEIGSGAANTRAIVANGGPGDYAASLCDQSTLNGYSDWFLPSQAELHQLYLQKDLVGGFVDGFYWSSTEHGDGSAWEQVFNTGTQYYASKGFHINVRAVRAF